MSQPHERSVAELSAQLESGALSSVEIIRDCLERIRATDQALGAFIALRESDALREAEASDQRRASGECLGPVDGIPIAVKDNLVSPDFEVTCASRILKGFRSPYEASVLTRLRAAGMVVLGTTNMDEFAMGSSCENSAVRPAANPWNPEYIPGGSSGGSCVAVAARQVPCALGSDTGGSIRQPAAHTGTLGFKPTYGRVSRYGLIAFASSLDQIGPVTRDARDAALLLQLIAGADAHDSTSVDAPVPDYASSLTGDVSGLRVGIPREFFEAEGADPVYLERVRAAVAELEAAGAKTIEVSLPTAPYGIAAYYLICTAEASSNLSRYDGVKYGIRSEADDYREMYRRTRNEGFGDEVKRRILLGTYVLSAGYYDAYYTKAQKVRTLIRRDFSRAFEACDVLATPTAPAAAWKLGELANDPLQMYLADIFTVSVNLAGLPSVSIPCGFDSEGLPTGLQLIAPALEESTLLRAADAYQRQTEWHRQAPSL